MSASPGQALGTRLGRTWCCATTLLEAWGGICVVVLPMRPCPALGPRKKTRLPEVRCCRVPVRAPPPLGRLRQCVRLRFGTPFESCRCSVWLRLGVRRLPSAFNGSSVWLSAFACRVSPAIAAERSSLGRHAGDVGMREFVVVAGDSPHLLGVCLVRLAFFVFVFVPRAYPRPSWLHFVFRFQLVVVFAFVGKMPTRKGSLPLAPFDHILARFYRNRPD